MHHDNHGGHDASKHHAALNPLGSTKKRVDQKRFSGDGAGPFLQELSLDRACAKSHRVMLTIVDAWPAMGSTIVAARPAMGSTIVDARP